MKPQSKKFQYFFKEFMTICKKLSKEQVRMAFAQFDTSGDDKLDYREFCEMIRKREEEARVGKK